MPHEVAAAAATGGATISQDGHHSHHSGKEHHQLTTQDKYKRELGRWVCRGGGGASRLVHRGSAVPQALVSN